MRNIIIQDMDGNKTPAFVPETAEDLQQQITKNKKQNFKEHLYMAFLLLGVMSFSIGIFFSIKRMNAK